MSCVFSRLKGQRTTHSVSIRDDQMAALEAMAQRRNMSLSYIFELAIEGYLEHQRRLETNGVRR